MGRSLSASTKPFSFFCSTKAKAGFVARQKSTHRVGYTTLLRMQTINYGSNDNNEPTEEGENELEENELKEQQEQQKQQPPLEDKPWSFANPTMPKTPPKLIPRQQQPSFSSTRSAEFLSLGGDRVLQNELADTIIWEAQKLGYTEHLDFFVTSELFKFRESLLAEYQNGQKGFIDRSNRLAMLESLNQISQWNQTLIDIDKETKQMRSKIRDELAVIDALLRRNMMKEANASKRRSINLSSMYNSKSKAGYTKTSFSKSSIMRKAAPGMAPLNGLEKIVALISSAVLTMLGMSGLEMAASELGADKMHSISLWCMAAVCLFGYQLMLLDLTKSEDD